MTVQTEQPDPDEEWTPALQAEAERYAAIRYEQQAAAWLRLSEGLEARGFSQDPGRSVVDAVFAAVDGLRAELDTLWRSGRLLPDGGVEHIDHGVVYEGTELHVCADRSACIQFFPHVHAHERTVTTWPDGTVLRRPWLTVEPEVLAEALKAAFQREQS